MRCSRQQLIWDSQGKTLTRKLKEALRGSAKHTEVLEELSATFEAATITEWTEMVEAWQADPLNQPDPFQESGFGKCASILIPSRHL